MLLMIAAEFVAVGAWEMFWFQGLSAGKRFEPSYAAETLEIGITRIHPNMKANAAASSPLRW